MRKLFFDIDGVLLNYSDEPKPALLNDRLQVALKRCSFDQLVCVSGHTWPILHPPFPWQPGSKTQQAASLLRIVEPLFSDHLWFTERLVLADDTDARATVIDVEEDFYYIDDRADEFFCKAHGEELYQAFLNSRILLVDPYADGEDIIAFLSQIPERTS